MKILSRGPIFRGELLVSGRVFLESSQTRELDVHFKKNIFLFNLPNAKEHYIRFIAKEAT